jgi:hypothetical protein
MTSPKFNGKKYIYWVHSVEIVLRGKGLFNHLLYDKALSSASVSDTTSSDGSNIIPTTVASKSLWHQEDNLIMSLMLSSIKPNIGVSLMHL